MKKVMGLIILMALFGCAENDPMYPTKAQFKSITLDELKTHLTYLASDEMKGRDTGSPELNEAAEYIAGKLKEYGYKSLAEDGSYLQRFSIYRNKFDLSSFNMSFKGNLKTSFGEDILVFSRAQNALDLSANVVYVVNGINDEKMQQFDADMIKGKIVIRSPLTDEQKEMKYNDRAISGELTEKHGALAVINLVPNNQESTRMIQRFTRFLSRGGMTIEPDKMGAVSIYMNDKHFNTMLKRDRKSRSSMKKSFEFKNTLSIKINSDSEEMPTQNVVGVLEGTDPELKKEYVAYSAHYDHVGVREGMEGDNIFNGADDNGSGTTTLLEVSQAIAMKPAKRSIIFIWYTAEEKGLVGSDYFSRINPLVPLDDIVALFNIDMVGRSKAENDTITANKELSATDEIYVIGADKISKELHDISEKSNKILNQLADRQDAMFEMNYTYNDESDPNRFYYRSDHYNFARYGVPIIFYFNGVHEDYHKASDHIDKIDFTKMRDVGSLAMATGIYVANQTERIKSDEKEMKKED